MSINDIRDICHDAYNTNQVDAVAQLNDFAEGVGAERVFQSTVLVDDGQIPIKAVYFSGNIDILSSDRPRIVFLSMNPGLPRRFNDRHRQEFYAMNSSFKEYWSTRCQYFDSNDFYYATMMNSLAHATAGYIGDPTPKQSPSHAAHRDILKRYSVAIELVPFYSNRWPTCINQHIPDLLDLPAMSHAKRLLEHVIAARPDLIWVNGNHMSTFLRGHEHRSGWIDRKSGKRLHYHVGAIQGVQIFRTGQLHSRQNPSVDEIQELAQIARQG